MTDDESKGVLDAIAALKDKSEESSASGGGADLERVVKRLTRNRERVRSEK